MVYTTLGLMAYSNCPTQVTCVQVCMSVFICKSSFNKNFRITLKCCRSTIKENNNLLLFIKCILFSFIHFTIRNYLCLVFNLFSSWVFFSVLLSEQNTHLNFIKQLESLANATAEKLLNDHQFWKIRNDIKTVSRDREELCLHIIKLTEQSHKTVGGDDD